MYNSIEEITVTRRNWVKANRENGFEEGIKNLLTNLYPDNAHFIYELLQNAEDAGAHEVNFALTEDALTFSHDGQRLFNLKDVDSITNIGNSTKGDDHTKIGKFGVGFKAVFAYTNTPEIHSGDYHFCIEDLVVPKVVESDDIEAKDKAVTIFKFPFNHSSKKAAKAAKEIKDTLVNLEDSTLLFLNNIRLISYFLPSGKKGSISRDIHKDKHVTTTLVHPQNGHKVSDWLRYSNDVIVNEGKEKKSCRISVAYSLQKNKSGNWAVKPLERGQVFIFFPAEKETSNLQFNIHAPFASTVARDSIRDCAENNQLRDQLANLIVQSLQDIKNRELLTVGFLGVLPNYYDRLNMYYQPIRSAIIKAFQENKLTPTRNGDYACAKQLYKAGTTDIANVIENDLAFFSKDPSAAWVVNAPQQHQREDRFLEALEMKPWGWSELANAMSSIRDPKKLTNILIAKTDNEIMRFYALLGELLDKGERIERYLNLEIVRVTKAAQTLHVLATKAYLPCEAKANLDENIFFVKEEAYNRGGSDPQRKRAKNFLVYIGVKVLDEREVIVSLLNSYTTNIHKDDDVHINDIKKFMNYHTLKSDIDIFNGHKFLYGDLGEGKKILCSPSRLYIDVPYEKTGLMEVQSVHKRYPLWNGYDKKLPKIRKKEFLNLLVALGVQKELQIEHVNSLENNPSRHYLEEERAKERSTKERGDFIIRNMLDYIRMESPEASRLLWNAIVNGKSHFATAYYKPNRSAERREADSQFVQIAKNRKWIPNKRGEFKKPKNISREELRDDFRYDDSNDLLTAIGFGSEALKQSAEYEKSNAQAVSLGFKSKEIADKAAIFVKMLGEKELDRLIADRKQAAFPEQQVRNPERRRDRKTEEMQDAQAKEYGQRKRSVRVSAPAPKEKEIYLKENYTNEEGQLVCQICKSEMPFKKHDNEYYFEKIEIFSNTYIKNEDNTPYLALCPLCAAKYKEFVKKNYGQLDKIFSAIKEHDNHEIPISLDDGKEATIRFVEAHYLDVQTVIRNEK